MKKKRAINFRHKSYAPHEYWDQICKEIHSPKSSKGKCQLLDETWMIKWFKMNPRTTKHCCHIGSSQIFQCCLFQPYLCVCTTSTMVSWWCSYFRLPSSIKTRPHNEVVSLYQPFTPTISMLKPLSHTQHQQIGVSFFSSSKSTPWTIFFYALSKWKCSFVDSWSSSLVQ